jgi:hypothetical protein
MEALSPVHRTELSRLLVPLRAVPVQDSPGETVWVVAQRADYVLYWSDVEEGWEWARLDASGGIHSRGCNQFELSHIAHQLFGDSASCS